MYPLIEYSEYQQRKPYDKRHDYAEIKGSKGHGKDSIEDKKSADKYQNNAQDNSQTPVICCH